MKPYVTLAIRFLNSPVPSDIVALVQKTSGGIRASFRLNEHESNRSFDIFESKEESQFPE